MADLNKVKLALEMNKLVHDKCKDAPHDIGLELLDIVERYTTNTVSSNDDKSEFRKGWLLGAQTAYSTMRKEAINHHDDIETILSKEGLIKYDPR